jgi:hypothetical protein
MFCSFGGLRFRSAQALKVVLLPKMYDGVMIDQARLISLLLIILLDNASALFMLSFNEYCF